MRFRISRVSNGWRNSLPRKEVNLPFLRIKSFGGLSNSSQKEEQIVTASFLDLIQDTLNKKMYFICYILSLVLKFHHMNLNNK